MKFLALTSALLVSASAFASVDFENGVLKLNSTLNLTNKKNNQFYSNPVYGNVRFSVKDSKKVTLNLNGNEDRTEHSFDTDSGAILSGNGPYNNRFSTIMRAQHAPRGIPLRNLKVQGQLTTTELNQRDTEMWLSCSETRLQEDRICLKRRQAERDNSRMTRQEYEAHRRQDRVMCPDVKVVLTGEFLKVYDNFAYMVKMDADFIDPTTGSVIGTYLAQAKEDESELIYTGPCILENVVEVRRNRSRDEWRGRDDRRRGFGRRNGRN